MEQGMTAGSLPALILFSFKIGKLTALPLK